MGMALALHTISDENIDKVLTDPPLIWRIIAPDDADIYEQTRVAQQPGFFAGLFKPKPAKVKTEPPELHMAEGEGVETDVDKAWHGIHYLLTGTAGEGTEPLNFLVCGGTAVGDIDVGYGPARVYRSSDVKSIVSALREIDANTLRKRFNPEEMTRLEIYPDIWNRAPEEDDAIGYCIGRYEDLCRFLSNADRDSLGIVLHLC